MAKNFLDQIFSVVGIKSSGTSANTHFSKDDNSLSGVARYLERQAQAEQAASDAANSKSGVEKYLERMAAEEAGVNAESVEAVSADAKTGVAKYLQDHGDGAAPAPAKPKSRIDKYIASHGDTAPAPAAEVARKAAPKPKEAPAKPRSSVEKYQEKMAQAPKKPAVAVKKVNKVAATKPAVAKSAAVDLDTLTNNQLRHIAKKAGMTGYSKANKTKLTTWINANT
ncbi:MAG: hypothetical protein V3U75_06070 [Methylococcaceae bacterium]